MKVRHLAIAAGVVWACGPGAVIMTHQHQLHRGRRRRAGRDEVARLLGLAPHARMSGAQRDRGTTVIGVELADDAVRLGDLPAARRRTVMVLGNESNGIPDEALPLLDTIVEIPMVGTGLSLNVAVAGSLVLYRLSGLI